MIPKISGVTCGNFGVRSNVGKVCYGAWHTGCFYQHDKDIFPVLAVNDLDNVLVDEEYLVYDDLARFMVTRDGDHLMTPFQCEKCHCFNMRGRGMNPGCPPDELLLICIRRATLDLF